ncbi:meiotic recombination protein DMC1 [Phlyctema vagabunda]|uniref:Meiotic recombination protein DMC1 n=1 Tax=Phlyctema vagabunda TaxID=108571 RepID=A0ABR4PH21_9HELO
MVKSTPTIGEYAVLPITLPPTASYPETATHHVYVRPHAPRIPTEDDERSLFLVNVPVDSTPAHFRCVFSELVGAGRFESISFESEKKTNAPSDALVTTILQGGKKRKRGEAQNVQEINTDLPEVWDRTLHKSGGTAVVVLADAKCVEAVLKAIRKVHRSGIYPVWGEGVSSSKVPKLGSARYSAHQKLRYPPKSEIQASVDAYMTLFAAKEEEAAQLAKRQRNVPDEDGFVTVSRGGRTGPARREEAEMKRKEMEEKEQKKKQEMGDFYRFQMREKRKEEQGELVKRFEEDRRRVEVMKEKRSNFRPEK